MKFFEICAEVRLPEVATEVKAVPLVETEPAQESVLEEPEVVMEVEKAIDEEVGKTTRS